MSILRSCFVALFVLVMMTTHSGADHKSPKSRNYTIAQSYPYPPWDVGPLEGVSSEVMLAICEANAPMKCRIKPVLSEECFDTDDDGNPVVGDGLTSGRYDGCLTWFRTDTREQLGAEFGHGYSTGAIPQLIASDSNAAFDSLGDTGSLGGADVAIFAGFFSDQVCLASQYSDFNVIISGSEDPVRDALVEDLNNGVIDLIFWDNASNLPEGTKLVGAPVNSCGPDEQGLAVYPPARGNKKNADQLRRDWNCGLALIRLSGELQYICESSAYPGGDPACVLEGPAPTVQCLEENPGALD